MLIEDAPPFVLKKLLAWERLEREIEALRKPWREKIEYCEKVLQGKVEGPIDYRAFQAEVAEHRAALAAIPRSGNPGATYERCREWLESLPPDAVLEPVRRENSDGLTLAEVRQRIAAAEAELGNLQTALTPSPDIRQKVSVYVRELAEAARPEVRGIADGEKLDVAWPEGRNADRISMTGFHRENALFGASAANANALMLTALMYPERLTDLILTEIDARANAVMAPGLRPARIAELENEITSLRYDEEHLVVSALERGDSVERHGYAPPECVLGVRVVMENKRRRTAY